MVWRTLEDKGIDLKNMIFRNSCFPCGIHNALYNMGAISDQQKNEEVEQAWQHNLSINLDIYAPDEDQIKTMLPLTPYLNLLKYHFYGPSYFKQINQNDLDNLIVLAYQADAVVFGSAHAYVVIPSTAAGQAMLIFQSVDFGVASDSTWRGDLAFDGITDDNGDGALFINFSFRDESGRPFYDKHVAEFVLFISR